MTEPLFFAALDGERGEKPETKHSIILNPSATAAVLTRLWDTESPSQKVCILTHGNAPEEILMDGIKSDIPAFRMAAAESKNATAEMLRAVENDVCLGIAAKAQERLAARDYKKVVHVEKNQILLDLPGFSYGKKARICP